MFSRLLLVGLLPAAATAQRLDLGLTGGVRQSFTDMVSVYGQGGVLARRGATSAAVGMEASYTFRRAPVRLSTGLWRGKLAQAFRPASASERYVLELRTPAWQVPLRLQVPLVRLGRRGSVGLRNGVVLQFQSRRRQPSVGGDYQAAAYVADYNALYLAPKSGSGAAYALLPAASRKTAALLLESGAELNYALTPALTLDLSVSYQAGLRQIEAPFLYRLDQNQRPSQDLLTAGTKGSNLLVGLTARYALKTWSAGG